MVGYRDFVIGGPGSGADEKEKAVRHADVAARMGVSRQALHAMRKGGTPRRDFAEILAEAYGGNVSCYLRPPKARGRSRSAPPFPFKEFVRDAKEDRGSSVGRLALMIHGAMREDAKVENFPTLESLIWWINEADELPMAHVPALWREFKRWRIAKVADTLTFDLDMGDDVSDETMRALLALAPIG